MKSRERSAQNRIKELTQENDNLKNKFEALLRKNRQLSLKLEAKSTTEKTPTQKTQSKEQASQTYQPGEYSNSNLSRNIINGSYKRRAVLLQAVEPQVSNKKAKMQFIYPVQPNSTVENHKNDPNLSKKKILIVSSNQINKELNNIQQTNPPISNPVPTYNQFPMSGPMINAACNTTSSSEKSDDRFTSKNEIAEMIAKMI